MDRMTLEPGQDYSLTERVNGRDDTYPVRVFFVEEGEGCQHFGFSPWNALFRPLFGYATLYDEPRDHGIMRMVPTEVNKPPIHKKKGPPKGYKPTKGRTKT